MIEPQKKEEVLRKAKFDICVIRHKEALDVIFDGLAQLAVAHYNYTERKIKIEAGVDGTLPAFLGPGFRTHYGHNDEGSRSTTSFTISVDGFIGNDGFVSMLNNYLSEKVASTSRNIGVDFREQPV